MRHRTGVSSNTGCSSASAATASFWVVSPFGEVAWVEVRWMPSAIPSTVGSSMRSANALPSRPQAGYSPPLDRGSRRASTRLGNQYHAWQATLDEDAVVFTTLPGNEPRPGDRWVDADLYWSGTGAMPRSAQSGTAAVHLYAPRFASPGPGALEAFSYLPFTHAYFPTERFDEVRQVGAWTLGRKGDGYVALWSWRPPSWRAHDPAITFTNGLTQPFDLVAEGGADNVWISEVGDAATWGSFDDFAAAVTAAAVTVAPRAVGADGLPGGFDVTYASPSSGSLALGTTGPFTVGGAEVELHGDNRFDNPFGTTPFGAPSMAISESGATLELDTERWTRHAESRPTP